MEIADSLDAYLRITWRKHSELLEQCRKLKLDLSDVIRRTDENEERLRQKLPKPEAGDEEIRE
jgi:hypothetical protein